MHFLFSLQVLTRSASLKTNGLPTMASILVMQCTVTSFILLEIFSGKFAYGIVTIAPVDREVLVGHSTFFNCSTSIHNKEVYWYFLSVGAKVIEIKPVYAFGKLSSPYDKRFQVDCGHNGVCNLVILSSTLQDAGRYDCQDDGGYGETKSAQLIVLDTNPSCKSFAATDELIGPNDCGIEPEELQLSCSVKYRGNIPPVLEWKSKKENESVVGNVTFEHKGNTVTYSSIIKADLFLNGSSYMCQTTRSAAQHIRPNCTSDVIHIFYAFNSSLTVNASVGDYIDCVANTSQICDYKWKWFEGGDSTTESKNETLVPKRNGWHRCEVTCVVKIHSCIMTVMMAYVSEEGNPSPVKPDPDTKRRAEEKKRLENERVEMRLLENQLAEERRRHEHEEQRRLENELQAEEEKRRLENELRAQEEQRRLENELHAEEKRRLEKELQPEISISAVAIFNGEIHTLRRFSSFVEVYDADAGKFREKYRIDGLVDVSDMISSRDGIYLYIGDNQRVGEPAEICRVNLPGYEVKKWTTKCNRLSSMSSAFDSNVIVCSDLRSLVIEYSCDGNLVREIELRLTDAGKWVLFSCTKSPTHDFLVFCHKYSASTTYLFAFQIKEGELKRDLEDKDIIKRFHVSTGKLQFCLASDVDKHGSIYVPDEIGNRVIILDRDFKLVKEVEVLLRPIWLWLDEKNEKMFVWGLDGIAVCPLGSGKRQIFSHFKFEGATKHPVVTKTEAPHTSLPSAGGNDEGD